MRPLRIDLNNSGLLLVWRTYQKKKTNNCRVTKAESNSRNRQNVLFRNMFNMHNSKYIQFIIIIYCHFELIRETRCNEGKQVGLDNGMCSVKSQPGKNQVDFMVRI